MGHRITQQQLESYLWGAAVLLRGTIDAGDYKQFIFPLLFYKRLCDVFDEETLKALRDSAGDEDFALFPENHRFQVPADAHWRELRKVSRDVGRALQQAMRAIETANPKKLFGIFGDAQWTNKDRLSDAMLRDLIEHFSSLELTVANLPEDELGQGYEYLIKQFADDSGHTAAEFYTNRTVVHLMTEMLDVQPGESVYDPTCGSGGMLLSCIAHLRNQKKEWRNVKLYGQERNLMTSSIARMNCFLHGIEDFRIERGDTLAEPKLVEGDRLMRFDVVLANPPYSIKQWDRDAFASDPWGRNLYGTPPQGRADYAFQQHILQSLKPKTGRCAVLWPHGVLFRQEEEEMRKKMIEADLVEAVIGLGPNLFYNASMESCVVICRTSKPKERRGKIVFINAQNEVTRERAQSFLTAEHIQKVVGAYKTFRGMKDFASVATLDEVRARGHSLKIDLFVQAPVLSTPDVAGSDNRLGVALRNWDASRTTVRSSLADLLDSKAPNIKPLGIAKDILASFNRSKWKRVRFGDVVKQMKEQVDPEADGIERYVAGEHMETENVHIRKWGTVGDGYLGPAFIRGFRKGQVLYGSRRTYLKKVAVAEWDGVTANTTFVLETVEGKMLQELLPWLMLSERFTRHSVQESKGSTNPYINFPDIAKFEFDLPPLDQQRRIAEILWAVDAATQAAQSFLGATSVALTAKVNSAFFAPRGQGLFNPKWPTMRLEDVVQQGAPIRYGIVQVLAHVEDGVPTLAINNLTGDFLNGVHRTAREIEAGYAGSRVIASDVLLAIKGATAGKVGIVPSHFVGNISRDLARIRCGPAISPRLLLHLMRSGRYQAYISKYAVGSTRKEISIHNLRRFEVPVPPTKEATRLSDELDNLQNAVDAAERHFGETSRLLTRFINCLF